MTLWIFFILVVVSRKVCNEKNNSLIFIKICALSMKQVNIRYTNITINNKKYFKNLPEVCKIVRLNTQYIILNSLCEILYI